MNDRKRPPRILIVTPELGRLPAHLGSWIDATAGQLATIAAALVMNLCEIGADVHVAMPEYRFIFRRGREQRRAILPSRHVQTKRLHLAQDRSFYYTDCVYSPDDGENLRRSLAFQREVINQIVPRVLPDLIHCHDWMTGLLPAAARSWEIPCLFTLHGRHTAACTLAQIEDQGIDAAAFWQKLFFVAYPATYEETRETMPVDFLATGVFAADLVNVFVPELLGQSLQHELNRSEHVLMRALAQRHAAGRVWMVEPPGPAFADAIAGDSGPGIRTANSVYLQNCFRLYESLLNRPVVPQHDEGRQFALVSREKPRIVRSAPGPDEPVPTLPALLPATSANACA